MNTCEVSDPECESPAGWGTGQGYATNSYGPAIRTKCYVCDCPVCVECSALREFLTWKRVWRKVRVCRNCESQYKDQLKED